MSEFFKKKRMTRLIGFGILIVVPVVFALSILFSDFQMNSVLSVFLIVLISCTLVFVYYLIFTHIEKKIAEKKKNYTDPFNR